MEEILEKLLAKAIQHHASDIHLTWHQDKLAIELRSDKIIKIKALSDIKLLRYLQYIANLDIGNQLLPQTGNFTFSLNGKEIYLRFAIMYCKNDINGVIRILNSNRMIDIDNLSLNLNKDKIKALFDKSFGLILISGPTSSGKTTSLYTIIKSIENKKIFTIEDPIEVYLPNAFQLEINTKKQLDYENGIKHLMRHDPDIIVIGEIRDLKCANMAIRAALTGHLVLATVHAGSCLETILRMVELGCDESLLMQVLSSIINQRLISVDNNKHMLCEVVNETKLQYYIKNGCWPKNHCDITKIIAQNLSKIKS